MSNFVVSARKYRPVQFKEVVGQQHVTNTLKNALRNNQLAHAFLFCGPRGVGKTTCARILAKALNCQNPGEDFEPCNTCSSCQAFNENASFNINELDAASNNSVEHIRALIEQVRFQPQQGKYKVFIIDEVHMLSQQAFNAFLKTLEEPPSYAVFILATTEKHKIIPTILSRCQIFDFKRIQVRDMVEHLEGICKEEGIGFEPEALHIIAQKADGALRDALSIFDRMVAFSKDSIRYEDVIENLNVLDYDFFFRAVDALLLEDAGGLLLLLEEVVEKGFEPDLFVNGLAEHLRNLLVAANPDTLLLLEGSEQLRQRYQAQAQLAPAAFLLTTINLANECDINYRLARNQRLHVEMALIKMAYVNRALSGTPLVSTPSSPEQKKKTADLSKPTAKKEIAKPASPEPEGISSDTKPKAKKSEQQEVTFDKEPAGPSPSEKRGTTPAAGGFNLRQINQAALLEEIKNKGQREGLVPALEFNKDNLLQTVQEYRDSLDQESVRSILTKVDFVINEDTVVARVGTQLAAGTIQQDRDLVDHLRTTFGKKDLMFKVEVDKSKAPAAPKRKVPLTDKEKLRKLYEQNNLVKKLADRFGLRIDD